MWDSGTFFLPFAVNIRFVHLAIFLWISDLAALDLGAPCFRVSRLPCLVLFSISRACQNKSPTKFLIKERWTSRFCPPTEKAAGCRLPYFTAGCKIALSLKKNHWHKFYFPSNFSAAKIVRIFCVKIIREDAQEDRAAGPHVLLHPVWPPVCACPSAKAEKKKRKCSARKHKERWLIPAPRVIKPTAGKIDRSGRAC
jgi:hypothetical protein